MIVNRISACLAKFMYHICMLTNMYKSVLMTGVRHEKTLQANVTFLKIPFKIFHYLSKKVLF